MMKKVKFVLPLFVFFISIAMGISNADAYPFLEVEGSTSADLSSVSYLGDLATLDVTYRFNVVTAHAGARMTSLSLGFEGDVFTSVNSLTFNNPLDWSNTLFTLGSGTMYEFTSAGTTLGEGDYLEFTANVTMYSLALVNLSGDWDGDSIMNDWSGGQIWGQTFSSADTLGGNHGGLTASPVPEPATMFLLGSGLLGMAGFKRKKIE